MIYHHKPWHGEQGQTMAEYGVMLGVITMAVVSALLLMSGGIRDMLMTINGFL